MQIGRVIGTERNPNTAYTFTFWTPPTERNVGIGTLVKVVSEEETIYGMVVEAHGFNDLASPLHEYMAFDGDPAANSPTIRPEMRVFEANVLRRQPEEPVSAVPIGNVFLADEADVQCALRTDRYAEAFGIPAGCYGSKDDPLAVHLHQEFLLGPESGHLNMTGTSGLAAKTSYILFLLQSIFQHYKDGDGPGEKGVATLLFNTKGGDLLYLDQEALEQPSELDNAIYARCGLQYKPFDKVRYYAPLMRDGVNLNTLRRNEALEGTNPTRTLTFGLTDVVRHAEVLLNRDDLDAKADGYLQHLNNEYVLNHRPESIGGLPVEQAKNIDALVAIVRRHLKDAEHKGEPTYKTHHVHTIRKMLNRLDNLGNRFQGLIATGKDARAQGPTEDEEGFQDRTVYVVDVAQLGTEEQDLVFAALITRLRERMEEQRLGVGRLVVVVDELNKYAPSGGSETYVVKSLKEIAARGRYLGLTLFGAQQFRSRVDKEVVGNAATHAFGHIEVEELSQPGYSYFGAAVKEKLGSLEPGEVLIKHPHFAQPIFIRFPRPSVMKGSDGMRKFQRAEPVLPQDLIRQLCRARGMTENSISDALGALSDSPENFTDVLRELRRLPAGVHPSVALAKGKRAPVAMDKKTSIISEEQDPFG